ncbi:alpha/beta fold hydrolase [Enhydrobacter aerosaccus]|uniref:alpha/beta fold hydrolase n=1 Tax=Enhydrobacter aerosaccus TaxID=225324 RepID=UPI001C4775FD|nr:alpha/beta hydrolase [Enhydrobacter aerosaccus]
MSLHVLEWGDPSAPAIVMLHGIRGYALTFASLATALQPDFRTIAYDQRGRGDSDWDPERQYYTENYVNDLAAVVSELKLERFDLLGHSMGGIAAYVYAAANPDRVRRLVIEDAGPGASEDSAGSVRIRQELQSAPTSFQDWDSAVEFMRKLRPTVTEAARLDRLRNMLKQRPDGTWSWKYDHAGIAEARLNPDPSRMVDLWPHVEAIGSPTLILRGGRSDYLKAQTAEAMCKRNPKLRWVEVADAGHYIHDDQPRIFEDHVISFLSGKTLSGSAS